jgi:hypothetical protein
MQEVRKHPRQQQPEDFASAWKYSFVMNETNVPASKTAARGVSISHAKRKSVPN